MPILFTTHIPVFPKTPSTKAKKHFERLAIDLEKKAQKAGEGSAAFRKKILALGICAKSERNITGELKNGRDIRAIVYLWDSDKDFLKRINITEEILFHIARIRPKQGLLALYNFSQIFFKYFDQCGDIKSLSKFISDQFRKREHDNLTGEFAALQKYRVLLFGDNGPHKLVRTAIGMSKDLDSVMLDYGVPLQRSGRFQTLCKQIYFLESLRSLSLGEGSIVFHELMQQNVARSPYEGGPAIGHEVIRILVEKAITQNQPIPDNWMKVILAIAGDPRVPVSAENYRLWWSQLEKKYIEAVNRALSRFDLKLFLAALDEFRLRSNNDELMRMFPSRKKFLEGLFDMELIGKTRLFVGSNARRYFRMTYETKELPSFASLGDSDKSIMYLQVGPLHMIEGSHSSYLWIYDQLPPGNDVLNYGKSHYGVRQLGLDIAEKYWADNNQNRYENNMPHRIQHVPTRCKWQKNAIDAFRQHGVHIEPEKVLTPGDYLVYKRIYGITSRSTAAKGTNPIYASNNQNLDWEKEVKKIAQDHNLATKDNRTKGGVFWVKTRNPNFQELANLGFRYKQGKGWWKAGKR